MTKRAANDTQGDTRGDIEQQRNAGSYPETPPASPRFEAQQYNDGQNIAVTPPSSALQQAPQSPMIDEFFQTDEPSIAVTPPLSPRSTIETKTPNTRHQLVNNGGAQSATAPGAPETTRVASQATTAINSSKVLPFR